MDGKYRKTDRERINKDRGDLKKNFNSKKEPSLLNLEDRGDSKTLDIVLHLENDKPIKKCCTTQTPSFPLKSQQQRTPVNLLSHVDGRRMLVERYTIRRKVPEGKERDTENKAKAKGISQKTIPIEAKELAPECGGTRDLIKPVLKILSKDDAVKLCKAVTFNFANKQLQARGRAFIKPSRFSMRTLRSRKMKPYKTRVRASSPTLARASPPTEVAKWAPSCLKHAKPYYEAWVDTTLAAISKEKRKLGDKELRTLAMKRPSTPELVYGDVTDEKFTGRIRVKI